MNNLLLNHQISVLRDPSASKEVFEQLQQSRRARFEKAKSIKPYWLPAVVQLDGVLNKTRTAYTDPVDYPLIVVGAITNANQVRVRLSAVGEQKPWSDEPIDALATAGADPGTTGMNQPFYFPASFVLNARNRLAVDFLNTTAATTTVYYTFICLRVFPIADINTSVDPNADREPLHEIKNTRHPRTVFLKITAPFSAAATAGAMIENRPTQEQDVPLLVLGATTSLRHCLVNVTDSSGNIWMPSRVPIWALASNWTTRTQPYSFFPKPYYLPINSVLRASFVNGFNSAVETTDADLTFICQTP